MFSETTKIKQKNQKKLIFNQQIKELEEEKRQAELRADLYHKMIEVAEEQFKIDIRKKYGAQLFSSLKQNKKV